SVCHVGKKGLWGGPPGPQPAPWPASERAEESEQRLAGGPAAAPGGRPTNHFFIRHGASSTHDHAVPTRPLLASSPIPRQLPPDRRGRSSSGQQEESFLRRRHRLVLRSRPLCHRIPRAWRQEEVGLRMALDDPPEFSLGSGYNRARQGLGRIEI